MTLSYLEQMRKPFKKILMHFMNIVNYGNLISTLIKQKKIIFGIRNTDNFQFHIGQDIISKCNEYKYLGVIFSKTRSFYKAIKQR